MNLEKRLEPFTAYAKALLKWLLVSACTGIICGGAGIFFHHSLGIVESFFKRNTVLIYLLPFLGLVVTWLYKISHMEKNKGTDGIFEIVRDGKKVSVFLAPLIFVSTLLTHLGGGSAGREGAALQIGGSLGAFIGKTMHLNENDRKIITLCGMAATFSGLFGTPLTAAIFCLEVINVGVFYYSALVPVLLSSCTAFFMLRLLHIPGLFVVIAGAPEAFEPVLGIKIVILGILSGLVSIFWCVFSEKSGEFLKKKMPNPFIRVFICGLLVVLLTYITGPNIYNGAGMNLVISAVSGEKVFIFAFLLKIIFTVLTLKGGFKGGEIVPTFAIGALFGSAIAPLLGLESGFASAIALSSVFCGAVNCPISSLILSMEMFGSDNILYFAIAIALSYMISGRYSLYTAQKLVFSKLEPVPLIEEEEIYFEDTTQEE